MSFLDTRHKKKSFTLTTVLTKFVGFGTLLYWVTYLTLLKKKGIAVNFGTMDFGSGNQQPEQKIKSEPREIFQTAQ